MSQDYLAASPLGQSSPIPQGRDPRVLFPIPRQKARDELGLDNELPFVGVDQWTAYEFCFLNPHGAPQMAVLEIIFSALSEYLIESKSLKLYLNGYMGETFDSLADAMAQVAEDLTQVVGETVVVQERSTNQAWLKEVPQSTNLDFYQSTLPQGNQVQPHLLKAEVAPEQTFRYYSHRLKSNCPVTGQPDWAGVVIDVKGLRLDPGALMAYILSYFHHTGFHEQVVERIFQDIAALGEVADLLVYARYTRRGGLDINPYRALKARPYDFTSFWRQ